jgi:hypothetical protein
MSRTYRRKRDASWHFSACNYDFSQGFCQKIWLSKDSIEYKKLKAIYHSDAYFTFSVPHSYINNIERTRRRSIKKQIHQWSKNPESYEIIIPKYSQDAGYGYW